MSTNKTERVVIIGASDNPERYSHRALMLLRKHGHEVIPVHPKLTTIEDLSVVPDIASIQGAVDTVTMYVGPQISSGLADKLVALRPRRVIFNPGAENLELAAKLREAGIACEDACTLVLLSTGAF
jgi:predicted CoA-binding protein